MKLTTKALMLALGLFIILASACTKEDPPAKKPKEPLKEAPEVNTHQVVSITQTSAVSGGEVTKEGTSPVTQRGLCWDTLPNPTVKKWHTINGNGLGTYVSQLHNLVAETQYYVRAYAISNVDTVYGSELLFETEAIPFSCGMLFKYQGKSYRTVEIGTQCWFRDNLNVGEFKASAPSGSPHSDVYDNGIIEKYCYNNVPANCDIYGGLYDWNEMMDYTATVGARGICPEGWHIPSDDEWIILINFLGGSGVAGGKMKEAGTAYWNSPNIGATNSSGFSGLPGGHRSEFGLAFNIETYGYFWSSTSVANNTAYFISLYFNSQNSARNNYDKRFGFSVRCMQD